MSFQLLDINVLIKSHCREYKNVFMAPQLRKIEKEVLIPRYLEYKITHELCAESAKEFADCSKESGFKVVVQCRDILKKFEECTNKYWRDESVRKEVEEEYLAKRKKYRETGVAEKSPFKRV